MLVAQSYEGSFISRQTIEIRYVAIREDGCDRGLARVVVWMRSAEVAHFLLGVVHLDYCFPYRVVGFTKVSWPVAEVSIEGEEMARTYTQRSVSANEGYRADELPFLTSRSQQSHVHGPVDEAAAICFLSSLGMCSLTPERCCIASLVSEVPRDRRSWRARALAIHGGRRL